MMMETIIEENRKKIKEGRLDSRRPLLPGSALAFALPLRKLRLVSKPYIGLTELYSRLDRDDPEKNILKEPEGNADI